jgi:hypothetical protein
MHGKISADLGSSLLWRSEDAINSGKEYTILMNKLPPRFPVVLVIALCCVASDGQLLQSDSLHLITGTFKSDAFGTLTDSSNRFRLLPGPLDSISLEDAAMKAIPGTITLSFPNDISIIYSSGFDDFGNRTGHVRCNWQNSGDLHAIPPPDAGVYRIVYGASSTRDEVLRKASGGYPIALRNNKDVPCSLP